MAMAGIPEQQRVEMAASALNTMETLGHHLRELIITQPPLELMGHIYSMFFSQKTSGDQPEMEGQRQTKEPYDVLMTTQFILEYVHAALASTPARSGLVFDERVCAELFECAQELLNTAMMYAMLSSAGTEDGVFGPKTAEIEFRAKSNWVVLRGNRYMVLDGEFYNFVLSPHDIALRETYGIGAAKIAAGFNDIANSIRMGQYDAYETITNQFFKVQAFADAQKKSFGEAFKEWRAARTKDTKTSALAIDDLFRGGICNISRHTTLPPTLLADLAFEQGEEKDFFAEGPYSGTPFRTLPVRKKPLIKLDDDYYAIDLCSIRDVGYRALLFNLLRRRPDYKKESEDRQKFMSESAVFNILSDHLKGATIYREVYYKDIVTKQWVENDTLILIDDVLMLVEAKSGAAATIASPALDFERHARAVQELLIKAYKQCKRFFEYLQSAAEVPIFKLENGKHTECGRLRFSDYRLMFPIGLTVESFSPFSAMCKELPEITPILGAYPFLSISIDDLFVLKRFLPTMGEFAHYLEVRQSIAGLRGVNLFDEFDHLGAYIKMNRFDVDIQEQMDKEGYNIVLYDGMSNVVDQYFEEPDWNTLPVPKQTCPTELVALVNALEQTRAPGWLSAVSHILNFGGDERKNISTLLSNCRATLASCPARNITVCGDSALFIYLQRQGLPFDFVTAADKAAASAIATKSKNIMAIIASAEPCGEYISARRIYITIPTNQTSANKHIYEDAARVLTKINKQPANGEAPQEVLPKRLGRNAPCWCGSGRKFKKCHGRS